LSIERRETAFFDDFVEIYLLWFGTSFVQYILTPLAKLRRINTGAAILWECA
jgi:hypothetical protein